MINLNISRAEYFDDGTGYVFNAGSPVWGIDWCPTYQPDRSGKNARLRRFMIHAWCCQLGSLNII